MSVRQVRRLCQAHRNQGAAGLISGKRTLRSWMIEDDLLGVATYQQCPRPGVLILGAGDAVAVALVLHPEDFGGG
jgi:hypothetical protein